MSWPAADADVRVEEFAARSQPAAAQPGAAAQSDPTEDPQHSEEQQHSGQGAAHSARRDAPGAAPRLAWPMARDRVQEGRRSPTAAR